MNEIPLKCGNCEETLERCFCWDDKEIHEIIAYKLRNNLCESDFLKVK